jgi:hypothetical protein
MADDGLIGFHTAAFKSECAVFHPISMGSCCP